MKYSLFIFLLTPFCLHSQSLPNYPGNEYRAEKMIWVEYAEEGIKQPWTNMITYSAKDEKCLIVPGSFLTILPDTSKSRILIKLESNSDGVGTPCENGAYWISNNDFTKQNLLLIKNVSPKP